VRGPSAGWRAAERVVRTAGLAALTLARSWRPDQSPEGAHDRAALLAEVSRRALAIHGVEVLASGFPPSGPALLVSNHLSYLDPLVLLAQTACIPISKSQVASWPMFGDVARRAGVLFVERSSAASRLAVLHAAEAVLREGAVVLNFPEGTTGDGSTVLPFRKGLFGLARTLRIPVVPAALRYWPRELAWTGAATFLPHYLGLARREGCAAEVAFGEPIPSQAHPSAERLAEAARLRTLSLLEDRSAWLRTAR